jgi:hypothetical protein
MQTILKTDAWLARSSGHTDSLSLIRFSGWIWSKNYITFPLELPFRDLIPHSGFFRFKNRIRLKDNDCLKKVLYNFQVGYGPKTTSLFL